MPLTQADLHRLLAVSGLTAPEFVEWCDPEQIDMEGEPETFACVREGRKIMLLSHVDGACCFLRNERCSVHPHRPTACAAFPFFMESDAVTVGRLPAPCRPACTPELEELRVVSAALTCELDAHAWRVHTWNRRQRRRLRLHRPPESSDQFLEFLQCRR